MGAGPHPGTDVAKIMWFSPPAVTPAGNEGLFSVWLGQRGRMVQCCVALGEACSRRASLWWARVQEGLLM